jgi:dCMP deaminase
MQTEHNFDWSELAFGSKKPLRSLHAVFIAAPREISTARLTQLVKEYLPKASIILGIAKEDYIDGFAGQPQFRTLKQASVQALIDKVNASPSKHKMYTLSYFQRELVHVLEKLAPSKAVLVNGSWQYTFHTLPQYYTLVNLGIPYELVSPYADEAEAKAYATNMSKTITLPAPPKGAVSAEHMMELADRVARGSFDNSFQTGVVLAKKSAKGYTYVASSFNRVVPYQTYAMHFGAERETHFSPPGDLNHYDTVHAEMELLVNAQKNGTDLRGTTMFINLMPCPTCARTLSTTDIGEYVYRADHSAGYAVKLFETCGLTVRRLV